MRAIDLSGFSQKFAADDDPWRTFSDRDEAVKRAAILHALGPGPLGRVLELASGNGANSRAIAPRALRLDATEVANAGAEIEEQGRLTRHVDGDARRVAAIARSLVARRRDRTTHTVEPHLHRHDRLL